VTAAPRSMVLLGASGLVGGKLLRRVSEGAQYASVTVLTRRPIGVPAGKVRELVVDFDRPETFRDHVAVDDVFCCLGTTIKKAGSQAAFRKVDLEAPLAVAQAAREAGATRYLIVTAVGASAKSGVFYNRVKGEVEAGLVALKFPRGVKILHPSLIMGERPERRPAESVAMTLMGATRGLFVGSLERYRAIDADDVAAAMLDAASDSSVEDAVYEGARLFEAAARGRAAAG